MLGDNAYPDGTDADYQKAVFEMYPEYLRTTPLWPALGNHDARTASSITQSGVYYSIFTLPTRGQSGGWLQARKPTTLLITPTSISSASIRTTAIVPPRAR